MPNLAQRAEELRRLRALTEQVMAEEAPDVEYTYYGVGTLAMLWVGGNIVIHGMEVLGFAWPAHLIHGAGEAASHAVPAIKAIIADAGKSGVESIETAGAQVQVKYSAWTSSSIGDASAQAMDDLRAILEHRQPLYARAHSRELNTCI